LSDRIHHHIFPTAQNTVKPLLSTSEKSRVYHVLRLTNRSEELKLTVQGVSSFVLKVRTSHDRFL
jgi:hypothetical protein